MSELTEHVQNADLGAMVQLYHLDMSNIDGSSYRFTNTLHADGSVISWNGNAYIPIPMKFSAMERTIQGAPPRPSLTVSNVNRALHAQVVTLGDLVGARVTRIRTFVQFLDGQANEDPTMILAPDYFVIEQKTLHTKELIQWTLSSVLDKEGVMLPKRQILRDKGFPGAGLVRVR